MQKGLWEFLVKEPAVQKNGRLLVPGDFYNPGYWTALAAYCKLNKIKFNDIDFTNTNTREYAVLIALENALSNTDSYRYERRNSGRNYSVLVNLDSADDINKANSAIAGCIRNIFDTEDLFIFRNELCQVVGELHDNVWSHGKNSGFSMAQKWKKPWVTSSDFEFALADCGLGFLAELKRVGLPVKCHEESIIWCIEKGNSSKKIKAHNEWSQRLPPDIAGNPIPGIGQAYEGDNHHMGLGLAKLIELVKNYKGWLWLSSGEITLAIYPNGTQDFIKNQQNWQGVALACRFDTENAKCCSKPTGDEAIESLVDLLRGY